MSKKPFKDIEAELFVLIEKKDKVKSHALKRVKASLLGAGLVFGAVVLAYMMQHEGTETPQGLLYGGGALILGFIMANLAWRGYAVSLYKKYTSGE